jgi:GGDEF domain-containing protein
MNSNDQYNTPAPNNLRLSKLSSIPSAEDLSFAMTLATNNPRNIVELPWKTTELPLQYTIKVTCALSLEEPRWMLHAGVGSETDAVIWNYDTPDYQLVYNLIIEECKKSLNAPANTAQAGYKQLGMPQGAPNNQYQQIPQPFGGAEYSQHGGSQPAHYEDQMQHSGLQDSPYGAPPFQPTRSAQNSPSLPAQSNMPVMAVSGSNNNILPSMAFGAAAASIVQPPPLVPPEAIAGGDINSSKRNLEQQHLSQQLTPISPRGQQQGGPQGSHDLYAAQQQVSPPVQHNSEETHYQQQQNLYQQQQNQHQQQYSSGEYVQTAPRQAADPQIANPFQQLGQQVSQGGLIPARAPMSAGVDPSNPGSNQGANQNAQSNTQGSMPAPYISSGIPEAPASTAPAMPSSRMFTLPQPGGVRNPAERLIDKATSAEEKPPVKTPRALPAPVKFDRTAVDTVFKMLTESELGFLNHGALMFFTVREFSRFQRNNVPFSIVLFELVINNGGNWEPMPQNLVRDVGKQLFGVMRPLDLIAHYEKDDYAMLLPHTSRDDSFTVVQRLHEMLNSTAVAPGLAAGQAQIFCGISTIPDDCAHPGVAIAAAIEAKAEAKLAGRPVLRFCDI